MNRARPIAVLLFILLAGGCEPLTKRPPAPGPTAAPAPVPPPEPPRPAPPPPVPEPDWRERARYWTDQLTADFQLPAPGSPLILSTVQGGTVQGLFESLAPDGVTLKVGQGSVTYPLTALSPESRGLFQPEERVRPQVQEKLAEEKKAFLRQQAEQRTAAAPSGPPVNAPGDGSVWQVQDYIATHVRNPETVRYVKWFPVRKYENGYHVRCHYYADGGSFGRLLEDKVFFMNAQGQVIRTSAGTGSL